jgi:hypothetical protein
MWSTASTEVVINELQNNPFRMFSLEAAMATLEERVALAVEQSLERGGDGEAFLSNWVFQGTEEEINILTSLGIELVVEHKFEATIHFKPKTIIDFKRFKEHRLYTTEIPTQEYSCIGIELDEDFIKEVDRLEARAQDLWGFCDPEGACARLWTRAQAMCSTSIEREYVDSRNWM